MSDPRWTAEFTVRDLETGASREVRIDSPDLADAVVGALRAMTAILGVEFTNATRQFEREFANARPETPGG